MFNIRSPLRHLTLAIASFFGATINVNAETYPSRPIKLVVPYPPGGLPDSFARAVSEPLSKRLGQPVIIENRPGGSLIIGTNAVAKSAPDGYTLLLGSASSLGMNPATFKKLPYNPVKDFRAISLTFYTPLYLVINPSIPVKSVKELIAYAKSRPGELSYASLGHGSSLHLAAETFSKAAGIELLHVPYKGPSDALSDLVSGRASMIFDGGAALPHVKTGKLRMLAVTSSKRLESLPEVPTVAESGMPGYEMDFWFGLVAAAGTPKPIVDRLSHEIAGVFRQPEFKEKMRPFPDARIVSSSPEELDLLIKNDVLKWAKLLKDAGVEPRE